MTKTTKHCTVRNGTVKYYNNMHSYSQLVLLSWGYTTDPPPNYMKAVGCTMRIRFFQYSDYVFRNARIRIQLRFKKNILM